MRLIESLKKKKFVLLNIFLTLYIGINLIGGERGLISYFDKKELYKQLTQEEELLITQIDDLKHKILLIEKNDHDYLDILFREKFKQGTKDDIIIKLRWTEI